MIWDNPPGVGGGEGVGLTHYPGTTPPLTYPSQNAVPRRSWAAVDDLREGQCGADGGRRSVLIHPLWHIDAWGKLAIGGQLPRG